MSECDLPWPVIVPGEAPLRVATPAEQDEFFANFLETHFGSEAVASDGVPERIPGLVDGTISLSGVYTDTAAIDSLLERVGYTVGEDILSMSMDPATGFDALAFRLCQRLMACGCWWRLKVQPIAPASDIVTVLGIRTRNLRDRKLRRALRQWRQSRDVRKSGGRK